MKSNTSTKEIIKKFSDFFSFFKDKKEDSEKTPIIMSTEIYLDEIKSKDDLLIGDVVLHKNVKLYKIIGFGKVQIDDQWLDTINYKEVFVTTEDQIYTRTVEDFIKSFKKVLTFGNLELRIKR